MKAHRRHCLGFLVSLGLLLLFWGLGLGAGRTARAQAIDTPTPPLEDGGRPEVATPTATRSFTETLRSIRATATAEASLTLTAAPTVTETTPAPTPTPTSTPTPGPDDILNRKIDRILEDMSVADRVGQLFIVDFQGSRVGQGSDIAELIQEYRIGGVVISPKNRNFRNGGDDTPQNIAQLTNRLQALAYGVFLPADQALAPPDFLLNQSDNLPFALEQQLPVNLPLLIGVEQAGDGLPASSLLSSFTEIPPQMALGATWNPDLVQEVGAIVGRELSSVGVNLLLGPNLDVLDQPRPELVTGLGLYTFGGDAYWVGRMGRAYVTGVHTGSGGRVATMTGHFPGQGGTDRRPEEEVATIQKSLQELQRIELPPFAAVTERASSILRTDGDIAATDGLMSGHIRFSSFQGSRERTPPISLATELGTILALNEFATWRTQGGVLMSDALGVPAVRRYYDPTLQQFPKRRIALDAFQAGNDLLYLSDFSLTDSWPDARSNIKETILFFRERYTSDADFAARVDESLRRILRLKLRLYAPDEEANTGASSTSADRLRIPLAHVLVPGAGLQTFAEAQREEAQTTVVQVAREALTILAPDPQGLTDPLPAPPQPGEKILIFTDSRQFRECGSCPGAPGLPPDALEQIMLRLYGPDATGQLAPEQVSSYTFEDLNALLNDTAGAAQASRLEEQIVSAEWLIFAMLDIDVAEYGNSDAVKQFLRLRSDRLRGKKIVVIAFNEPYFLDATEISKLTAYLGAYSKTQPFLEAAVRVLFRALTVTGAPPVNVPGTRYSNLIERLEPDPARRIDLSILNEEVVAREAENDEVIVEEANLAIGDSLEIEAGPILDHNGNPVPDGTPVNFRLAYEGEELALQSEPVSTRDGIAHTSVPLDRSGTLLITASSVGATASTEIRVRIPAADESAGSAAQISIFNPTPTPLPSPTPTPQPPVAAVAHSPVNRALPEARVDLLTLAVASVTQLVVLALLLVVLVRVMPRSALVHRLLWAMIVGWGAYIFYGLGIIPGGTWLQRNLYPWGSAPVVLIGMLIPLVWLQLRPE